MKIYHIILNLLIFIITCSLTVMGAVHDYVPPEMAPDLFKEQFILRIPPPNLVTGSDLKNVERDWQVIIDSTWGAGASYSERVSTWESFYNAIDDEFSCFQNLSPIVWDSVWNLYAPEIYDDTTPMSRGRFAAILNHASRALKEPHTKAYDYDVRYTELLPGVPLLYCGGWGRNDHFGAACTPLADSTALVYRVADNHPLGLEPGDIILGYEGIPWKELYQTLLAEELPTTGYWWGSSPASYTHSWLMAVGANWHLFDTIDVIKYDTKDTVHLPTNLLIGHDMSLWATEQMPVPGVPFPDYLNDEFISHGYIEGTKIAYVYVIAWINGEGIGSEFLDALYYYRFQSETDGLILDFRTNYGGSIIEPRDGYSVLFDGTVRYVGGDTRYDPDDHFAMEEYYSTTSCALYSLCFSLFEKPIAVLVGPGAVSAGDYSSLAISHHPLVKMFGKPTSCGFTGPQPFEIGSGYKLYAAPMNSYSPFIPNHYLTHDEFPSDTSLFYWVDYEDVWLTPDGVANEQDDVVEAALEWIYSMDDDGDEVIDPLDNCPDISNANQEDFDLDGIGDSCDNCIEYVNPEQEDDDGDGIGNRCDFTCGDVNQDLAVNIIDITYVIAYIYQDGPEPVNMDMADTNGSGEVNILDITKLISYLYSDLPAMNCP